VATGREQSTVGSVSTPYTGRGQCCTNPQCKSHPTNRQNKRSDQVASSQMREVAQPPQPCPDLVGARQYGALMQLGSLQCSLCSPESPRLRPTLVA
jgi:hypothetical protein